MPQTVQALLIDPQPELGACRDVSRRARQRAGVTAPVAATSDSTDRGRVMVMNPQHPARAAAEHLIEDIYRVRYDAEINGWMPFLAARAGTGAMQAAAGFRPATTSLYLENYLDHPVETAIANHVGRTPRRESIVEVGHLASRRGGAGAILLLDLADHLRCAGYEWLVNTATADTRQLILGLKAAPLALAAADPARLPDGGASWGTYYRHEPVVLAIHLPTALGRRRRSAAAPA